MLNREKLDLTTQIARLAQEVYDVNQLLVQEKAARQLAIGYMAGETVFVNTFRT